MKLCIKWTSHSMKRRFNEKALHQFHQSQTSKLSSITCLFTLLFFKKSSTVTKISAFYAISGTTKCDRISMRTFGHNFVQLNSSLNVNQKDLWKLPGQGFGIYKNSYNSLVFIMASSDLITKGSLRKSGGTIQDFSKQCFYFKVTFSVKISSPQEASFGWYQCNHTFLASRLEEYVPCNHIQWYISWNLRHIASFEKY